MKHAGYSLKLRVWGEKVESRKEEKWGDKRGSGNVKCGEGTKRRWVKISFPLKSKGSRSN